MKTIQLLFFFFSISFSISMVSQVTIEAQFIKEIELKAESVVGIDKFETFYFINKNTLHKKNKSNVATYSNLQLGEVSLANTFNPLKINLFYKNFNTAVILDNRLAEIHKIDFNSIQPYKNVSHISTGFDNTLWIFNNDAQQLELFDYKTKKSRAVTIPISSRVIAMVSNYNFCWLLTEDYLYTYNYFGTVISKMENENFTAMAEDHGNLILQRGNTLLFKAKNSNVLLPILLEQLLINQFFVTNETVYIYGHETLQQLKLKIN